MALHQTDVDEPKRGIVLSFRTNEIPIGEPGSPVLAWGLCLVAIIFAASTFLAIRYGSWVGILG